MFSISFKVASGVDCFVGMTAAVVGAGVADFFGAAVELLLVAADELLLLLGVGVDFSVETDTLGLVAGDSDVSGAAASGAGVEASSWPQASGAAARTNAVRARMVIFMVLFGCELLRRPRGFPLTSDLRAGFQGEANPILPPRVQSRPI